MSYHPISAGHAAREAPRSVEQEDIGELVEKAQEWLGMPDLWYETAVAITAGITTTASAAGLLAINPQLLRHSGHSNIGVFISALWNCRCPEKVIIYPHNTPEVDWIGERLPGDKVLVAQRATGEFFGHGNRGPVIAIGQTETPNGIHYGPFISAEALKDPPLNYVTWPENAQLRPLSETGTPGITLHLPNGTCSSHISQARCRRNKGLKNYLNHLLGVAKEDGEAIETVFGGAEKINSDIQALVNKRPWQFWKRVPRPWEAQR